MSARDTGMGLWSTAAGLLLVALLGGALAACGHYGPPVRAEEYREAAKARKAERQLEREKQRGEVDTPEQGGQKQDDGSGGEPPAPGTGDMEGLEAP